MKKLLIILLLFSDLVSSAQYSIIEIRGTDTLCTKDTSPDSTFWLSNGVYTFYWKYSVKKYFPIARITGLTAALAAKAAATDLSGYSLTSHTHTYASNTSKPTSLSGYGITDGVANTVTVNGHALSGNVSVTPADLSLNNVTNTSDANKPVSAAQQTALDLKVNIADTASALSKYLRKQDTAAQMLPYLRANVAAATYQVIGTYATGSGSASGTNTGDNSANSTYNSDYRAANFIAGTNYLAPAGNGSLLTGLTPSQVSLGNVTNESKATMHTNAAFTGTFTAAANSISQSAVSNYTGYTLAVQALTSSPTDAQTIYFGNIPRAPTTTQGTSKIYIRKAGTIKIAEIYCQSGTAGTNEAWVVSIRLNNSGDTQIASVSLATGERIWSNTGLSIAVVAGDYIEIKSVNPTWATNPLTTIMGGYIYIE